MENFHSLILYDTNVGVNLFISEKRHEKMMKKYWISSKYSFSDECYTDEYLRLNL